MHKLAKTEAEELRVAELERQAALKARLEALRPDQEKLVAFADLIRAHFEANAPDLQTQDARDALVSADQNLYAILVELSGLGE